MKVKVSVPSKTFLIGEYAALNGGPSLVVSTEPRFSAEISAPGDGLANGLHPQSPAGLWMRSQALSFQKIDFIFKDPHQGAGGFGASSAQFLMAWIWSHLEKKPFSDLADGVDVKSIWDDFLSLFSDSKVKPSGVDLLAQATGGLTRVTTQPLKVQSLDWNFSDVDFLLVPTKNKVDTHKHLNSLDTSGIDELQSIATVASNSLETQDAHQFIGAIKDFETTLAAQGKTHLRTMNLLEKWKQQPGVLAGKGCGALGADSFVLFVEKSESLNIRKQLSLHELPVLASSLSLSSGLSLSMDIDGGESKPLPLKPPQGQY